MDDAKKKSWKTYCSKLEKNPFTLPYKIAANKIKREVIFQSILNEDGKTTKSQEETIRYILNNLYGAADNTYNATEHPDQEHIAFTETEVHYEVNNIRRKICPGPDDITNEFIQCLYQMHRAFFLNIFNTALKLRHFPSASKVSKVILIPKNKEHSPPGAKNLRPIVLNSILGKIFEKLLYYRLYHYFESNKSFPDNQLGFKNDYSAITTLYKFIVKSLEKNDNIIIISLDITKAFGNIIFGRLKQRFNDLKILPDLSELVFDTIEGRKIMCQMDSQNVTMILTKGTPQASPLSPFLWNVIVSELLMKEMPGSIFIQAFADDLTVVKRGRSKAILERKAARALEIIEDWSARNELSFSHEKCEFINLGAAYKNRAPLVKVNGRSINDKEFCTQKSWWLYLTISFLLYPT